MATAGTIGVANAWNPVGWVIVGTVAIATVTMVGVIVYTSTVRKNGPDSYARPGQKKQGREHKNKARKNKNWKPRPTPKPPKKHTPGRDHRKY